MATTFLTPKNNAATTLAEPLDDSETGVDVTDASVFPADGDCPFHVTVDDEIMTVTGVANNTLTVTRGAESTTPAAHDNGKDVSLNITAEAISDLNTAVNALENAVPTEIEDGTSKFEVESTDGPLVGTVAGVEVSRLSAVGILTLAKQAISGVYLGTDQKLAHNAWPVIKFDNELWDIQNEFNISRNSGTATTGTTGTTLKDTDLSPFVAGDVGKTVWNDTDGSSTTTISVYASASEVTLSADIGLASGEAYTFGYSRFTATEAGKYLVSLGGGWQNDQVVADKLYALAILQNGAYKINHYAHASFVNYLVLQCVGILNLAASDYVEGLAYQSSGAAQNLRGLEAYTNLFIAKLS